METKKRRMTLMEYLKKTDKPNNCFTEDGDCIYFRSRPSGLCLVIDKNTYYTEVASDTANRAFHLAPSSELRYFDMMTVSYRLPRIPKNSSIRIALGRYYVADGPYFQLTEPKYATHAMIFDMPQYPNYYKMDTFLKPKYDGQEYHDNIFQVIPRDKIFDWLSQLTFIAQTVRWEEENFLRQCQISFFKRLDDFYCQA